MKATTPMTLAACAALALGCGGTLKSTTDADSSTDGPGDVSTEAEADVDTDAPDPCEAYPDEPCVVLPHEGGSREVLVDYHTDVDQADFYLLVDTTGTMDDSITDVAATFTSDIRPAAEAAFGDVRFGLGHFNDFPTDPYGQSNDMPFWHMLDVSTDLDSIQTELDTLPGNDAWGNGQDLPEANAVALTITATGLGLDTGGASIPDQSCTSSEAFGYPCFRASALPVVILISDAVWHNGEDESDPYDPSDFTTHDYDDAVAAFNAAGIKFMGVHIPAGGADGLTPMEHFASDTASLDAAGDPLVSTGPANTAGERTATLIDTLRAEVRFDVSCLAVDEPDDPPGDDRDATVFVQSIAPESATPPTGLPDPTSDATTFHDVTQGTDMTFLVTLENTDHPSGSAPVESLVWIVALGDGTTEIGRVSIMVIVP
ncbi:MAG: VWA domain-containing protein [Deltaproteobacteria bacterium]|nr:VWA domain-containing protein [Deltaproteobacteria bacterium]